MPKRLRWYLEREPQAISAVLHILLRVIDAHLRKGSGAGAQARFGAVSFIHRSGASLNRNVHYHCCVIDGVFEPAEDAGDSPESVRVCPAAELTPEAVAAIAKQVRVRLLRWFGRSALIEPEDVREMLAWENCGFSLDAAVRVGAHDRVGLEHLEHFCTSPIDVRFMESYRRSWRRRQCLLLADSCRRSVGGECLLGFQLRTRGARVHRHPKRNQN